MINTLIGLISILIFPIIYIIFVILFILKDLKKYTNINGVLWILLSICFPVVNVNIKMH